MPAAMLTDLDDLDLEAMKALVRTQHEQLSSRASEIAHLKLLLDKLQRMLFGAKSEKLVRQVTQLELQLEELETARAEEELATPLSFEPPISEEPKQPSRRSLPQHLPREVKTHPPEASCCPDCGGTLHKFGEDISEVLEYVPESFKPGPCGQVFVRGVEGHPACAAQVQRQAVRDGGRSAGAIACRQASPRQAHPDTSGGNVVFVAMIGVVETAFEASPTFVHELPAARMLRTAMPCARTTL